MRCEKGAHNYRSFYRRVAEARASARRPRLCRSHVMTIDPASERGATITAEVLHAHSLSAGPQLHVAARAGPLQDRAPANSELRNAVSTANRTSGREATLGSY